MEMYERRTLHECVDWNNIDFFSLPNSFEVALYMSASIEISMNPYILIYEGVALYMSAWIEIESEINEVIDKFVALYMSAWIEIRQSDFKSF